MTSTNLFEEVSQRIPLNFSLLNPLLAPEVSEDSLKECKNPKKRDSLEASERTCSVATSVFPSASTTCATSNESSGKWLYWWLSNKEADEILEKGCEKLQKKNLLEASERTCSVATSVFPSASTTCATSNKLLSNKRKLSDDLDGLLQGTHRMNSLKFPCLSAPSCSQQEDLEKLLQKDPKDLEKREKSVIRCRKIRETKLMMQSEQNNTAFEVKKKILELEKTLKLDQTMKLDQWKMLKDEAEKTK